MATAELKDVKLVLCDVGGVLFHFKDGLRDISYKTGLPYGDCEKIWREMDDSICRGEVSPQELWEKIKYAAGYKGEDVDFVPFWVDHFQPIQETHQFVQDVSQDRRVGLLTNIYPGVYESALKLGKIPDVSYNCVVQSCELGTVKPDPTIYEIAQREANIEPNEILFIDDSPKFITPARDKGWNTFTFEEKNASENVRDLRLALDL